MSTGVCSVEPLDTEQPGPLSTPDPFLFCVYHFDRFPAGDGQMRAPRRGNGADFAPGAWRMYHGDRVPGFPMHPHRGFETITATLEGLIDHTDSHGNGGRYGHGDLQWMTAGSGVQHAEMFPLVHSHKPNPCRFFQIWLNLPARSKMARPAFEMHWAEQIPTVPTAGGAEVTVWAGQFGGRAALSPPADSWASDPESDLLILHIRLAPGASVQIPAAAGGAATNRCCYLIEGEAVTANQQLISQKAIITLAADRPSELAVPQDEAKPSELLVLQGRPIGEPVARHGPFVMNTKQEIEQAFIDYQATQFGGWPWPQNDHCFPVDKGRFAHFNGVETKPPSSNDK